MRGCVIGCIDRVTVCVDRVTVCVDRITGCVIGHVDSMLQRVRYT